MGGAQATQRSAGVGRRCALLGNVMGTPPPLLRCASQRSTWAAPPTPPGGCSALIHGAPPFPVAAPQASALAMLLLEQLPSMGVNALIAHRVLKLMAESGAHAPHAVLPLPCCCCCRCCSGGLRLPAAAVLCWWIDCWCCCVQ